MGTTCSFACPVVAESLTDSLLPTPEATQSQLDQGYEAEAGELEQVTSVSQLSDVIPSDWAFQALQSLVERYGCIAGYPDQTFRGNRSLSRYEFAAGLNACLDRITELVAAGTADLVKKEDLVALQKLQEEFQEDLAELRGRIEPLEGRITTLEKQQFSTTTKLSGEVVFNLAGVLGDDKALNSDNWRTIENTAPANQANITDALLTDRRFVRPDGTVLGTTTAPVGTPGTGANAGATAQPTRSRNVNRNPIFGDRVRLNLLSSFTGQDQLLVWLETINLTAFNAPITGTNMTRVSVDGTANLDNDIQLGKVFYRFPVGDRLQVVVDAIGGEFYDNINTINPFFASAVQGSVSRFGRFSPIYRASNTASASNTGAGITLNYKLGDSFTISGGYLARRPSDPSDDRGLFDGSYGALVQFTFQPNKDFILGLTYAHSYFSGASNDVTVSGAYGSAFANAPFGAGFGSTVDNPRGVATSANYYGIQASYRIAPWLAISGWGLYTQAIAEDGKGLANVSTGDKADIWSWMVGLAFPDAFGKGNLAGLMVGMPPKVTKSDFGPANTTATTPRREDEDTSLHLEALFRYQITDNISITPGFIMVLNPEHNNNNDTVYVGVIRTTFRF
ncbi:MAG TPA: carbohydrate porin [Leptolyngbyaceae cyanobacterium M33_DOE_097]|nr:carbohydrate porin [Leptolyngbyaceae cyanobacterium M33_DOE_097]